MNKILQLFVLVTLTFSSFEALGECCTRVAVIDAQKIIENSSAYKSISTQVEKEAGFYQSRASDLEKNFFLGFFDFKVSAVHQIPLQN